MTDQITLHRAAIKSIGQTITGLITVFDLAPEKLDSAELPALYPLTSQASYNQAVKGESMVEVVRVYRVQVPVIPIGLANPQTRESMCQPLIESVVNKYQGYPTLNNCAFVRANGVSVLSDSGIVVLPEWGAKYVGFEIRLQVIYYVPRTYAAGE